MKPIELKVKAGRNEIKLTHGWFTGIMSDGKDVVIDFKIDCPGCKKSRLKIENSHIDEKDCLKLKLFFEKVLNRIKEDNQ